MVKTHGEYTLGIFRSGQILGHQKITNFPILSVNLTDNPMFEGVYYCIRPKEEGTFQLYPIDW